MKRVKQATSVCPTCGHTFEMMTDEFGCPVCLLQLGLTDSADGTANASSVGSEAEEFGSYTVRRNGDGSLCELGRGAMGVTYRAVDNSLGREVALKIIRAGIEVSNADARERFMREARAAASLRHPNVATVHHFGIREETGQCFCAMELIEGETLEDRVRRTGPLDVATVVEIARQIAAALAAAEKRGLVHRDLKPANIMIQATEPGASTPAGPTVKIIDFGIAKALAETPDARVLTHHGFVGTPAFASPEQFAGAPVDVRSDIFSLGATLWYLLTGRMVFAARPETRRKLPTDQLKAAGVPSPLIALLGSMLATEPAARPSVHDLSRTLEAIKTRLAKPQKNVRLMAVAAALMAFAAATTFLFFQLPRNHRVDAKGNIPEKSIAVLPLTNLSAEADNAFFVDGLQDEILTNLAKIADLKVISRTSVMHYGADRSRNLREIGQELGVAHVLQGSVQRVANKVRVMAQLIDTRSDAHLWAQTYDRDLSDVFAIQSEISRAIVGQLQAKMLPNEQSALEQPPTHDIVAFDLYSRAKNLLLLASGGYASTTEKNIPQAIAFAEQAVRRDPSFFLAHCLLAQAHDQYYFLAHDRTPERLAQAQTALDAAARLRPDAGETHLASAQHRYWGYLDYPAALARLDLAQRSLPNEARIHELRGYIARRQGKHEESLRHLEHALSIDPRNFSTLTQIGFSYRNLRRYREAAAVADRAIAVYPENFDAQLWRAGLDLFWKADTRPTRRLLEQLSERDPVAYRERAEEALVLAIFERNVPAAEAALAAKGDEPRRTEAFVYNAKADAAFVARMAGDEERARAALTAAREEQQQTVHAQPNSGPSLALLALYDAALGRKEAALQNGGRAMELLPVEKDAINGARLITVFATTAAWAGEKDVALEHLSRAARLPAGPAYGELKLNPDWDSLRGDPRFEELVASLAPKSSLLE